MALTYNISYKEQTRTISSTFSKNMYYQLENTMISANNDNFYGNSLLLLIQLYFIWQLNSINMIFKFNF